MKKATREWVRKAEGDWRVANREAAVADPVKDAVCFHCQQCAEKYLKALLQELGRPIAKTHDLQRLFLNILPFEPSLMPLRRGAVSLTQYAVDYRYPGFSTTAPKMRAALRNAGRVRLEARRMLGLPP
jgi:HEPN domain-containing protein